MTSFRTAKLSSFITDNIKQFKNMLEQEIELKEQNEMNDLDGLMDDRDANNKAKDRTRTQYNAN